MKHIPSEASHLLILQHGEELHDSLIQFATQHGLTSAWLSGLGGSGDLELGFYELDKRDYKWQVFDGPLEIVSLTGNLTIVDNKPFWHIHGVFSGKDFKAVGGHVRGMTIGLTCELHIKPLSPRLTRTLDNDTGLKLIEPATN